MKDHRFEIRVAGFGGQGIVTIGRVLGEAFTIHEGVNSVNTRSYGPESRGGASRSEVVASQGEIHYPSVRKADMLVALSQPALDKYKSDMKEGGILLIDPNSVKDVPKNVACYEIPAMEIAHSVGSVKYQSSVVLGALAALLKSMLKKESLRAAVSENVPPKTVEKNMEAFEKGWEHLIEAMAGGGEKEKFMGEIAAEEKKSPADLPCPTIKAGRHYLEGSEACVEGALLAGLKVYAGYPITPASEIMEHASRRLPQFGGRFIQMEDEISAACALIGASWAGAKAMTATSSPGFSLMQEAISFSIMTETPLVIVDVQRPGPGQGYITTSQEDVMQARYGHHGEGPIIALAPCSVQDMFELTIEAFNLSEKWRTPVLIMAEETVAHMREQLIVPELETIELIGRKKPRDLNISPEAYLPYGHDIVPPLANFGEGYNINHVSLAHSEDGNVGNYSLKVHRENIERLHQKIEGNVNEIARVESQFLEDCEHVLICYGSVARTGLEAVKEVRQVYGIKMGFIRLVTLWPFPEEKLRNLASRVKTVFVPEMNLGMMKHPITEALRDKCDRVISIPEIGALHSPEKLLDRILEVARC